MAKDTLVLASGTRIPIDSAAGLSSITAVYDDVDKLVAVWREMTAEALADVSVENAAGLTVGHYTDLVLKSTIVSFEADGVKAVFDLEEKTDIEKRLDALEAGQDIQDGAIEDLGLATSTLAEGGMWGNG